MTILGLHHVQITFPRGAQEQGRQFHCRVLGLPEIAFLILDAVPIPGFARFEIHGPFGNRIKLFQSL